MSEVEEPDEAVIDFHEGEVDWVRDADPESVAAMVGETMTYLGNPVVVTGAELIEEPAKKSVRLVLRNPRRVG